MCIQCKGRVYMYVYDRPSILSLFFLAVWFVKGMQVSQLAEAMFLDAWDYHSNQSSTSEATANSALFYDSDIRRITEVRWCIISDMIQVWRFYILGQCRHILYCSLC